MRIIFLGTPDFAVASLKALVVNHYDVVAVVTAPDKPAGRGMKLQMSAVKQYAVDHNIPVLQPEKLKSPSFIEELSSFKADLQVVVAFRMLPEVVWNMPPLGTINVHASLLPKYRGAAPIHWAIMNGETVTGVTTFKLKHQIDTGDILLQQEIPILDSDNVGILYEKLMQEGAQLLIKTLIGLQNGSIQEKPQELLSEDFHAPKIFKEHCEIDWNQSCRKIYNQIRGLSPIPAAFTKIHQKILKIYTAEKIETPPSDEPGSLRTDKKTFLDFACADGYIRVLDLQLEGKSKMAVSDFLKGYHFP